MKSLNQKAFFIKFINLTDSAGISTRSWFHEKREYANYIFFNEIYFFYITVFPCARKYVSDCLSKYMRYFLYYCMLFCEKIYLNISYYLFERSFRYKSKMKKKTRRISYYFQESLLLSLVHEFLISSKYSYLWSAMSQI